jgi:tripeptide aminopeptidase
MHLNEQRIMGWQAEMVAIPAPPFGEQARAQWLEAKFRELSLDEVGLDRVGNAVALLRGAQSHNGGHCVLLSAHIDTVFPSDTPIAPELRESRLMAPGACDNAAGVVALLAIAAAMRDAGLNPACDLLLLGNVGEEGEGNLRGIRHIYEQSPWRERIAANVVLDGAGHEVAVTQALGSRRFLVTISGPGGHSWTDAGRPNPIVVLSEAIARMSAVQLSESPRTTLNVGTIEGGTSVNAIPEQASARFDLRSTDAAELIRLEVELHRAVEDAVLEANRSIAAENSSRKNGKKLALRFAIENIGERPAGLLAADANILETLRAVDRHLGIRTETRVASTDANIPLSRGIEAISMGAGGDGGGVHTRGEWYDGRGRDLGLRRILLLVLALADHAAQLP